MTPSVSNRIVIVGGGIAGLTAAVYLARAGRAVTIFERRRTLGGRAATHIRHGYRFNLGPHAVYRAGASSVIYRELGIPIRGGDAAQRGLALFDGREYQLPATDLAALTTSLLGVRAKLEAARLLLRLGSIDASQFGGISSREWLDRNIENERLRVTIEAMMRLATYAADSAGQSAEVALRQLQIARRGVVYMHEGWQKIVDSLHSHAVTAGVTFVTSSHVVGVEREGGAVKAIELGELELDDRRDTVSLALPEAAAADSGTRIPADVILLAVDPQTVSRLAGSEVVSGTFDPVLLSTLDVALSRLPHPKRTFALGIDQPHYFSVHSRWAQLTPSEGALIHVSRYGEGTAETEGELERLLETMQPGWRDVLVHRRYLPSMTVSNMLVGPGVRRPSPRTAVRGLYLAGDWVGDEGILSDAALSSARAAAQAIIADT